MALKKYLQSRGLRGDLEVLQTSFVNWLRSESL